MGKGVIDELKDEYDDPSSYCVNPYSFRFDVTTREGKKQLKLMTKLGRMRVSDNFSMSDFLYCPDASVAGICNYPSDGLEIAGCNGVHNQSGLFRDGRLKMKRFSSTLLFAGMVFLAACGGGGPSSPDFGYNIQTYLKTIRRLLMFDRNNVQGFFTGRRSLDAAAEK